MVTPADIATYLGSGDLDDAETARLQMLIDDAVQQALSIVAVGEIPDTGPTEGNLPVGYESVVRPAVARIYLNPTGVTQETTGPFGYTRSSPTGAMFSKAERAQLRRLAMRSAGAFTIDPTSCHALDHYIDPLRQPTSEESLEYEEETGFTE